MFFVNMLRGLRDAGTRTPRASGITVRPLWPARPRAAGHVSGFAACHPPAAQSTHHALVVRRPPSRRHQRRHTSGGGSDASGERSWWTFYKWKFHGRALPLLRTVWRFGRLLMIGGSIYSMGKLSGAIEFAWDPKGSMEAMIDMPTLYQYIVWSATCISRA